MLFLIGYDLDHESSSMKMFKSLGNESKGPINATLDGTYTDLQDDFKDFADDKIFIRKWMFYSHLLNVLMQLIVDSTLLDLVLNKLYYLFKCGSREDQDDLEDEDMKDIIKLEGEERFEDRKKKM